MKEYSEVLPHLDHNWLFLEWMNDKTLPYYLIISIYLKNILHATRYEYESHNPIQNSVGNPTFALNLLSESLGHTDIA
jgi:hypothetical protein